jgi:hypothetical protein
MKTAAVKTWLLPCLLGGLALATPALAQDEDAPYAYPDEEKSEEEQRPRRRAQPEEEDEEDEDFDRMARLDDPNTGIAFEALGGAMLLSSAKGQFADVLPAFGGRFTWEYGRLLNVEALREALWFDVRYTYAGMREGTKLIVGNTQLHYASIAPAYELTFGDSKDYGAYVQVGGGIAYAQTSLAVGDKLTTVDGLKSLVQYGLGLRGRTKLSANSNVRLAWRLELMRFRRGYLDDTFLGASLGTAF